MLRSLAYAALTLSVCACGRIDYRSFQRDVGASPPDGATADGRGADGDGVPADGTVPDGATPDVTVDAGWPGYDFVPPDGYEVFGGFPEGGEARDFAWTETEPVTVYVTFWAGRIFRSDDGGVSYIECTPPSVEFGVPGAWLERIAVLADDPDTVFLTSSAGAVRSHDGCRTWVLDELGDSGDSLIRAPDGTILIGANGIQRWNGSGWDPVPSPFDGQNVDAIAVSEDGQRWAAGNNGMGVILSDDAGATWELRNDGLGSLRVNDIAIDPVNRDRLYVQTFDGINRSVDGGVSWVTAGSGTLTVAVHPVDSDFVVYMGHNDLRASEDALVTSMGDRRSPNMDVSVVQRLRFDPLNPNRLFAASRRGLFMELGRTFAWAPMYAGIRAWQVQDLSWGSDGALYAASPSGVLVSTDGGATFTLGTTGITNQSGVRGFAVDPGDPTFIALAGRHIWTSADRGQTWDELLALGSTDAWGARDAVFSDAGLHVITHRRLLHFSTIPSAPVVQTANVPYTGSYDAGDIVTTPDGATLVLSMRGSGIYASSDGGASFVPHNGGLPASPDVSSLAFTDSGVIFVLVGEELYRADSLGATWQSTGLGLRGTNVKTLGERVFFSHRSGHAVSEDAGGTWTVPEGLAPQYVYVAHGDGAGGVLVGTRGYGILRVP